jgi:hypothetical protein
MPRSRTILATSVGKDVSRTWHQAGDDSGAREGKDTEHFEKTPTIRPQTTESGIPLYPDRK